MSDEDVNPPCYKCCLTSPDVKGIQGSLQVQSVISKQQLSE